MTRSKEFIKRNAKILVGASDYFNVDSTLMRAEEFDTAKLKVMFVFPSPATDKAVSLTAAVINDFILTKCPGVFVDFAYIPHQKDYKLFDKERIPYAVGSITHLDASHFDVVGFSMSILYEAISAAWICNTFNRCDTPIPLTWSERKDLPFGKVPILCGGGIVSSLADILFGDLGDGRKAFLDFIHLGEIHCIKPFYDYLISVKDKGVPVQKVIDNFWESEHDSSWLYQPQAYDVEYNDRNQIIKNIKINPSAPDMCKPYFPDEMPDCLESARGIIMGTGKNAGLGQIHAANGCSRSGFCNFSVASNTLLCTENGVLDISRVESGIPMELQSAGVVSCKGVVPQQSETVYRVKLESGLFLDCSINHKWIRRTHGDRRYTTKQIRNILYRGGSFEVLRKVGNHFNIKESHVDPLVEEIVYYSKLIDLRANISYAGPVVWTKDGFRYRTEHRSGDNSSEIIVNRLATCLNFVGYDTTVCSDPFGALCIYFWPVANSVVHDKVVSVTRMHYKDLMYDVVETTDHTVCYNSIITLNCHEGSYCIPGGTQIKSSVGVTNIEDFKVGDEVVVRGNKYKVVNTVEVGVRDAKIVTLYTNQEIKMANTHLMLVLEDGKLRYKRAYDLKEGDWLVYDNTQSFGTFNTKYAYLIGLILGDGFIKSDCEFEVCLPNFDKGSSIDGEFSKLFKKWHYSVKTKGASSCVVYNREVSEFFKSIGFTCKGAYNKRIPKVFFNSDKETARSILQGLFDTDGCVTLSRRLGTATVSFCSVSKGLIYDTLAMLSMFGIVGTIYRRTRKTPGHYKKDGNWIKHSKEEFELVIVGESNIRLFEDQVGFRLERKSNLLKSRKPYTYDVEYIPTFEARLRELYSRDKQFNKNVRRDAYDVRKIFMGWNKKVKTLSKRHISQIFHLLPEDIKEDLKALENLKFYQIKGVVDAEPCMMYDVEVEDSHAYSILGWLSHNTGGWVENSPERLVELAKACRKYTAATILKGFSFNSNYLSDYKRNIYDWLDIFPKVTFNNMRLEELGLDRDALKMMQLAGYQRMTAPIEGVSRRIRNNLLNKNLSDKSLDTYLEYGMMMGAVDCKVGIINTGYEEEEDWKEFIDFNIKWQNKCKELGGSIPFRYKGTVLVHQPHTPMEYMERKSIRLAYYGDKFMPDLWNDERLNIRFQINGFKHSSFIEQAILDLGRSLTSWMYQKIILKNIPMYNFRPIATHKEVFESLRDKINVDYFFNRREFDEYISVVHRVHIAMHANVILQAKKIMEKGVNASPTIRCLKTYDGCQLECKVNSFAKDPIVVYGDVWKKEDGKLDGVVWEDVKGCRRCKTPEDRKKVMGRVLPKSKNADDILTHKAPSIVLKLRFVLHRNADFQYLNPRYTQFAFFAKFLQMSDELCEYFWEVENAHNLLWQSEDGAVYPMVGTQLVDVRFKDRKAFDLVKSLIPEINKDAKSFKVVDVFEVPVEDKIKSDYYNLFYFESSIPAELWHFLSSEYQGEVKVVGASGSVETIQDEKLKSPDFVLKDKVKGYFLIPCRYSPWNYLQGLMSRKRVSVNKILKTTDISCVSVFKESNIPCLCGKEAALVDVRTGKLQKVGVSCMTKLLVSRL